VCKIVI